MPFRLKNKPAYSLVFAFLMMVLIMYVAASANESAREALIARRNLKEGATQMKWAATSAAQLGILALKDYSSVHEFFEGSEEKAFCLYSDATINDSGDGDCITWGDYEVFSKAAVNDSSGASYTGMFFTPIPGTGSAGDQDDCSILTDHEDPDHPCNWNKLMYGDSITIPLYSDDGSGGISVPADLGLDGWVLRVRTPCANGSLDGDLDTGGCDRYTMDEDDSTDVFDYGTTAGDSVVFWQLVGEDTSGGSVSVVPDDTPITIRGSVTRDTSLNTEIYESLINDTYSSGDFEVMEVSSSSSAPFDEIYNTCMGDTDGDGDGTTDLDLSSLSLQLDIVTPLIEDGTGDSIPYLEWQLITDSTDPFGDTKAVIIGEGYHQGDEGIFYHSLVWMRSITGESTNIYTLSN